MISSEVYPLIIALAFIAGLAIGSWLEYRLTSKTLMRQRDEWRDLVRKINDVKFGYPPSPPPPELRRTGEIL